MHVPGPARTARLITSTTVAKVGRHLRAAHEASSAPGRLDARLVIGDNDQQIDAAQAAVDLVILDGHGYRDDARIGRLFIATLRTTAGGITAPGLVLGCCYGASQPFLDAVTTCLDAPTTLLGCPTVAPFEHAEPLYTALLRHLTGTTGLMTTQQMQVLMTAALATVTAEQPRRAWERWVIKPLTPASATGNPRSWRPGHRPPG